MTGSFEIFDAQVHLNQLGTDWRTRSTDELIAAGIQTMDAVGVDRVMISEARGFDAQSRPLGTVLPNGAIRNDFPFAERAVQLHPDRFIYHVVVDFRDPEVERLISQISDRPGAYGTRIVPVPQTGEVDSLAAGEFGALFAACERNNVPVFCWVPGRAELMLPYIQKFPDLTFIIDHTGAGVAPVRFGQLPVTKESSVTRLRSDRLAQLDRVCDMAQYPNVALKWCHAPSMLSEQEYPFNDVLPLLRQAIDAFGVERIMWASDCTVSQNERAISWAQCLYYLLDSDQLSSAEKAWLLGGSVRRILGLSDG